MFAAVGSLGLVTTDSSQGQRSWSAVGPKAAVETTLTRLAAMSPYATFVRWTLTVSSSCQMEIPAELIRLAMSLSASGKLSVGLKMMQPGKAASRHPQQLAMAETKFWP